MNQDPSIDDRMTANGYVRCGGCGGFLPAGAICGYCLQQQQAANAAPRPKPQVAPAKPWRTGLTLSLLALVVCGVGVAAVFAVKGAGKMGHFSGKAGNSTLASLGAPGSDGSDTMAVKSDDRVMAALNEGNPEAALSAMSASSSPPAGTMQATSTPDVPTMQTKPTESTPTMQQAAGMPDDIRRWLEHLQKVEQARTALAASQLTDSVRTLTGLQAGDITHAGDESSDDKATETRKQNERAQRVGGDMQTMQQAWRTLLNAFDSVPAPAECASIKSNYDQVISQTGSMIMEIVGHIKSASNDPQSAISALTAMQGTSKSKIDVPARASDKGVENVCRKYDTVKWFDIASDVGGGTMSQLGF